LRDNEDLGVALKLDSSTPEKWFIEKPEALRAAIGAPHEDHEHPLPTPADIGAAPASEQSSGVAVSAGGLYDFANGMDALGIYDGETYFYGRHDAAGIQIPHLLNTHLDRQALFCNAIGAEPAITTLPVSKGGTGATTAAGALTALGAASTTHKSSHATGGTDALTPEDIGAAPASDINPDVANSALELRDNEDTGAVALKCDGAVYPQDNPWSVLFPDKFCTAIGAVKGYGDGEPPNENIAPAAMELRDNEDLGVALKLDSSTPEKWFIEKPEALRAAIGAPHEDHEHSASDIRTTVVRAQIPQGDLLFYFDSSASPYNDRPIYRTPSGYTLWFNSTNETWNISENLLFFEQENILLTSDEDNRQHPWEAAWTHDITLATLADYTQEAFKTWASKNDLLNLKNSFASGLLSSAKTTLTGNGTLRTFTISGLKSSDPNHVMVAINGVAQEPTADYLVNQGSGTITFTQAIPNGAKIVVVALGLYSSATQRDPDNYIHAFAVNAAGTFSYYGLLLNSDIPATGSAAAVAKWSITRSALSAAGAVTATAQASNVAWTNRETAAYA